MILITVIFTSTAFADQVPATPASPANAKPASPANAKPTPIDITSVIEQLDVFKNDLGMFLVVPRPTLKDDRDTYLFYGDGKHMYQQLIIGSGSDGAHYNWTVWSPRARELPGASIDLDSSGLRVQCSRGSKGTTELFRLSDPDATAFLKKAKFMPPLWQRRSHLLARDDDGVYYFVDKLTEELGGKGFRVFAGQTGAMKELAMTNIVRDSRGQIFATKTGELKIVASQDGKAYWKKGGKKTELVVLEPGDNRYLIYRELGIYGPLGVVCDEQ